MKNSVVDMGWSIAQGVIDDKPVFIRYCGGLNTNINKFKYPFQIGIAAPLLNPTMDGLTNNEEAKQLWQIEDELISSLTEKYEIIPVLFITTGGMREFVFYVSEWKPEEIEVTIKEVERKTNHHKLQFIMQEDREWKTYEFFTTVK